MSGPRTSRPRHVSLKANAVLLALPLVLVGCGRLAIEPPTPTEAPLVPINVYFTDSGRYRTGVPPFEAPVVRHVPAGAAGPEAVLTEFFKGPSLEEQARGLIAVTSGFTGVDSLQIRDGIAHVRLAGACQSMGATYTVAQPLIRNLTQFEDIRWVKLYDADGVTGNPDGEGHSIPPCLEP